MDGQRKKRKHNLRKNKQLSLHNYPMLERVTLPSLHSSPKEFKINLTIRDLESDTMAVWALYDKWCLHYNIHRTAEEMSQRFNIFKKNAIHVSKMNKRDSSCQFYLSSSCDEKDLFDLSGYEEMPLKPTQQDLESEEAVWDLYYRWCLYHRILRTPIEMKLRLKVFKMNAFVAVTMNQKDPSSYFSLSEWSDKIQLCDSSVVEEEMWLTPTKKDLESEEDLMDLYRRWCQLHDIVRTPAEMQLGIRSFRQSAAQAFAMSQKDPTVHFCLSKWCDGTDHHPVPEVKCIPTERDLKSGNALLGLYLRYCRSCMMYRTPEQVLQRFNTFKKSVKHVFEMNEKNPPCTYELSAYCDEKNSLDRAAQSIVITPTFMDLASDGAVMDLYQRWCLNQKITRTPEEMHSKLPIFKETAQMVFEKNMENPGTSGLNLGSDEPFELPGFCTDTSDEE